MKKFDDEVGTIGFGERGEKEGGPRKDREGEPFAFLWWFVATVGLPRREEKEIDTEGENGEEEVRRKSMLLSPS